MFTQSQIDQFHHDGTIVAKNLIKGEELEKLQEAADKVVNKAIENTRPSVGHASTHNRHPVQASRIILAFLLLGTSSNGEAISLK